MTDLKILVKPLVIEPALALLEFSSIAAGVFAGDAMVKRAQLGFIRAGTVQPGRYLILIGGSVAEVEEALKAGQENALGSLNDHIFLAGVHPDVVRAIGGGRATQINDALGIVETQSVPAAILAADKGIKGAQVSLLEIRLADGLNGKGLVFFCGLVSDVEAAIELSTGSLQNGQLVKQVVIAKLHADMTSLIQGNTQFGTQLGWQLVGVMQEMAEYSDRVWQSAEVAYGYLEGMRGAIPLAPEQLDIMIRVIRAAQPELKTFIDIGCGDGILGHTILAHYPDAQGVLLDFSEPMIEAARHKLATNRTQLQFIIEDYGSSEWVKTVMAYSPFDVIVSGFSIHHQPDIRKKTLYSEIYDLLKPGGIFINIEHVAPESEWAEERFNELFIDSMIAHNQRRGIDISPEETEKQYYEREHRDANILTPLDMQFHWMRDIGFQQVTCYLKIFELAVFGGIRPHA